MEHQRRELFFRERGAAAWRGPGVYELKPATAAAPAALTLARGAGNGGGGVGAVTSPWGPLGGYVPSCPLPSGEFYVFLMQVKHGALVGHSRSYF